MASDAILRTYGDVSAREDVVLNAVEILTAQEGQVSNMLGKTVAINTVHAYLTDTLRAAADAAVEEAADYTASANSTPTRLTNIVQITAIPYKVSRTQQDISHYQGGDELARQTEKALKDYGNSVEFSLLRNTLASGVSGTAPKIEGMIAHTSRANNHTSHTSTTAFSATILDGLMRINWENSNGDVATNLLMGSSLKATMDSFTQKTNVVVNNAGGQTVIVRTVASYETSFGTLMILKHRYIQQSSDAHGRIFAIRPDKGAIAFLKKPYVDTGLARSGDYDARAIVGKWTFECHNRQSFWYADGFIIS